MSPTAPQFMFDFGSPNAFLSHEAIPAIEKRTGVKFEYVPILLGGIFKATNNRSPGEAFAGIKNKLEFHQLETKPPSITCGLSRRKWMTPRWRSRRSPAPVSMPRSCLRGRKNKTSSPGWSTTRKRRSNVERSARRLSSSATRCSSERNNCGKSRSLFPLAGAYSKRSAPVAGSDPNGQPRPA